MRGLKRSIKEWRFVSYFRKGRRWLFLLLCVLLAMAIWLIQTLEGTYTKTIEMEVERPTLPKKYAIDARANIPERVLVKVTSQGGRLFRYSIQEVFRRKPRLQLALDTLQLDESGGYWSFAGEELTRQVRNSNPYLSDYFAPGEAQIRVEPDLIGFNYEVLSERKLPIYFNSQVDLGAENNRLLLSLELIPDEVTAYGPQSVLEAIEAQNAVISTDTLPLLVESDSVSFHRLALISPEGVQLSPDSVTVKVDVELLAYHTYYNTEIAVDGLPEDYLIRLFPSTVKVTFLALNDIDVAEMKEEILLYVDVDDITPGTSKLRVKLRNVPEQLHMIQLEPDQLEFIIEEK